VPQPKTLLLNGGNGKPDHPTVSHNDNPEVAQTIDNHFVTTKEDFRLTYSHDTLVCRNSKLTLFVNNADQVYWSFGSDLSSVDLIIEENTRVEAMVHTKEGKDTIIRVNITVCDCELFIPTAFTPNGDGLNDEWMVYAPANVTDFECMVYDKAGTLLFHTRNIHQGWNGMNNGKYLPAGGYFYSCRYRDELGNLHVQKGQVTLVR
jgi:gliding motility-associated-like protein